MKFAFSKSYIDKYRKSLFRMIAIYILTIFVMIFMLYTADDFFKIGVLFLVALIVLGMMILETFKRIKYWEKNHKFMFIELVDGLLIYSDLDNEFTVDLNSISDVKLKGRGKITSIHIKFDNGRSTIIDGYEDMELLGKEILKGTLKYLK